MEPEPLPQRRSIRLQGFDYSQDGVYSVTICTPNKVQLFGNIAEMQMNLNTLGQVASRCLHEIPCHFPNAKIMESIVMPNHVHAVIFMKDDQIEKATTGEKGLNETRKGGKEAGKTCLAPTGGVFGKPKPGSIPTIVGSYKSAVTKMINRQFPKLCSVIWQRGYYERVIRDEKELASVIEYIRSNPANWERDEHYLS